MTTSDKIIRLTFWITNASLVLMVLLYWSNFSDITPTWLMVLTFVILVAILLAFSWMRRKWGIKSFKGIYWTDDERDIDITMKVHSELMKSSLYILYGLLFILMILSNQNLSAEQVSITIFVYVWLSLFFENVQYYWLWNKYKK